MIIALKPTYANKPTYPRKRATADRVSVIPIKPLDEHHVHDFPQVVVVLPMSPGEHETKSLVRGTEPSGTSFCFLS